MTDCPGRTPRAFAHAAAMSTAVALALALTVVGCGRSTMAPADGWTCPPTWVRTSEGACGPAILVCAGRDAGAPDACNGVDLRVPQPLPSLADSGLRGPSLAEDGAVLGAWPAADWHPDVPAADWSPDAGVPTCPAGWTRNANGSCDPALRMDCPAGTAALPGRACTATGEDLCGAGPWPDPPAGSGAVAYVRAGADRALADGTQANPWPTIDDAVRRAPVDGTVLVAEGDYTESLSIASSVNVVGRCAARVRVVGTLAAPGLAVTGTGTVVTLRGLTITRALTALSVASGASLTARGLRIEDIAGDAVSVEGTGSRADVADIVVRGVDPPGRTTPGRGLRATVGTTLVAERVAVSGVAGYGSIASGSRGSLRITDAVIRDGRRAIAGSGEGGGNGAIVVSGAELTLERVAFINDPELAIVTRDAGSVVRARDVYITGTTEVPAGAYGHGLSVFAGGRAELTRATIVRNASGVLVANASSHLSLVDSFVGESNPPNGSPFGRGLSAQTGGRLEATNVRVVNTRQSGAWCRLPETRLVLRDVIIDGVSVSGIPSAGTGVTALDEAHAELHNVLIRGTPGSGINAMGALTRVDVRDARLELPPPVSDLSQLGIVATTGATITAQAVRCTGSAHACFATAGAGATLEVDGAEIDVDIARVRVGGYGVAVESGTARVRHVNVLSAMVYGVAATNADSVLDVSESTIRNVRYPGGVWSGAGIMARDGAQLRVQATRIDDVEHIGIVVAGPSSSADVEAVNIDRPLPFHTGRLGEGVRAQDGASVRVRGAWFEGFRGGALSAVGDGASIEAEDVVMRRGVIDMTGYAVGVAVNLGARATLRRVAVTETVSIALRCNSWHQTEPGTTTTTVDAEDLYVSTVRSGILPIAETLTSSAVAVATSRACAVRLRRAALTDGGFGFVSSGGRLAIEQGVIARQLDGVGALLGTGSTPELDLRSVEYVDNASNRVVAVTPLGNVSLPPPTRVCVSPPCP